MVKILLVHDGGKEASCVQSHLSDNLQIELWQVRSIAEGEEKYPAISPDIILAPLTWGEDYDLGRIVSWQRQCNVHGHHPGFLLFSMQHDDVIFFDISQGSFSVPFQQSDASHQIIASIRQVSGRAKVERSLREDYDHHNRIISTMPLSCLEVQGGVITRVNPAFLRTSGYDEHEILGRSPDTLLISGLDLNDALLRQTGVQKTLEAIVHEKSDREIPCRITVHSWSVDNPGDGIWFIEDRSEYAALSSVLRETEYKCREQLYLADTLVIRLDPDGFITFVNPSAVRSFGYDVAELTGNSIGVLFPPGAVQDMINPATLFLEVSDESSSALHIFEHCKKNGSHLWVAWTSRGLYDPDNTLTGIICVGTDMTEQVSNGEERISTRAWRDRILSFTDISPEVFDAVLQACIEIGREGREGKTIGTSFLIGDSEEVLKRSRQLILNPFSGHPPDMRNISAPDVREMLKEYALLDGAFVVSGNGLLEAAGRYITVDTSLISLPKGMGTRHSSVAALTFVTDAIGFVVSESGGKVSIMKKGKIVKVIA